jgi:hypothetical protein
MVSTRGTAKRSRPKRKRTAIVVVHGVADQPLRATGAALTCKLVHAGVLAEPRESTFYLRPELPEAAAKELERELEIYGRKDAIEQGSAFSVPVWRDRTHGVDLYELHWADLSRPARSLLGLVAAFLGVLFSLPTRGLDALALASEKHPSLAPALRRVKRLLELARFFGNALMPSFGFAALGTFFSLVPLALAREHETAIEVAGFVGLGLLGALVAVVLLQRRAPPEGASQRWTGPLVGFAALGGVVACGALFRNHMPLVVVAILGLFWAGLGVLLFRKPLAENRLAVACSWAVFVLTTGGWLAAYLLAPSASVTDSLVHASMWVLIVTMLAVGVCYALALACLVIAGLSSVRLMWPYRRGRRDPDEAARVRCHHVVRTATLTHVAPLLVVLFGALPVFGGLVEVLDAQHLLPETAFTLPDALEPVLVYRAEPAPDGAALTTVPVVLRAMVRSAGTRMLPSVVGPLLFALVFSLLLALPVLVQTIRYDAIRTKEEGKPRRAAQWLDRAMGQLVATLFACALLSAFAMLIGFGLEGAMYYAHAAGASGDALYFPGKGLVEFSAAMIAAMGIALAGSATVLALPNRARDLLAPLWPALDIVGDVDTYLQVKRRAPILARAYAVLAHVRSRDTDPYDQVIVVSHSQGTTIMAEAFRCALRTERDRPPLHFVTMGTPLVHLYYRFFATTFDWVERATRDPAGELGVQSWTNLYAFGDYVGTSVWNTRLSAIVRDLEGTSEDRSGVDEREFDGVGHNQYWEVIPRPDALVDVLEHLLAKRPARRSRRVRKAAPSAA